MWDLRRILTQTGQPGNWSTGQLVVLRSVLALSFVALGAAAAAQMPPTGALPAGGTGLIAGQVVDPYTGKPIPEVLVTLRVGTVTGPESPRVLADAQGRFVFINVPAGRYGVSGQKAGYSGCAAARDFDVSDGQILTNIIARCSKWAVLGGTVTDEAGAPVVGVRVDAYRKTISLGRVLLQAWTAFSGFATTDDRGMYRLPQLPPGEYTVGVATTLTTFPPEVMSATQGPASRLRSQAFYALSDLNGPLGDANNQQVGEAVLLNGSRTAVPPSLTDAGVTAVYRTTFSPSTALPGEADFVALRSGDERSGVDVALRPVRAVRVSGRLVGPEGPMPHTVVRLLATGRWQILYVAAEGATATALTDANGRFTFLGVPEGEFVVVMREGDLPAGWVSADQPVTVGSTDIADVILTARPSPRITGRFELRSAKPPESTTLSVTLTPTDPGLSAWALVPRGPELRFSTYIPRGAYRLMPRSLAGVSCTAVMRGGRDITDDVFVIGADDIDLTVICGEPATRLAGTVRKDDGGAEASAVVVAFPTELSRWSGPTIQPRRLQTANPDGAGAFTLLNLPPGDYFVAAIPAERSSLWQDPKFLDVISRSATRVSLAQGESRSLDLRTVVVR